MVYDATLFNTDPYYDDFNVDKKFLRMLFRPGYAVQARELTQLQTIIQNQVKTFGDHIFNDGSRIIGGEITNQDVTFIRVNKLDPASQSAGGTAEVDVTKFLGTTLTLQQGTDTRKAKVLHGLSADTTTDDDYYMLFLQYLSGSSGGEEGDQFGPDDVVQGISGSNTFTARISATGSSTPLTDALYVSGVTGTSKLTTVSNGIYFYDGYFVKTDTQSTSPYGTTGASSTIRDFLDPTSRVGFSADKQIINYVDDYTLRDPASGSYNYNAPGADRFKINLNLSFKNFVNSSTAGSNAFADKNFFEVVRFVNGNTTIKKNYTDYSEIEKTLARRTYDESGSYTVKPFEIDLRESLSIFSEENGGSTGKAACGLQSGKAYVFGYELETVGTQYVLMDKGLSSDSIASHPMNGVKFGQYVKVRSGLIGETGQSGALTGGFPIVNNHPKILLSGTGGTGTARVRAIVPNNDFTGSMTSDTGSYNMYLFDIALGGITAFGHINTFGGDTTLGAGSLTAGFVVAAGGSSDTGGFSGATILFEPHLSTSIFPAPIGNAIKNVSSLTYRVNKGFTFKQTSASTVFPLPVGNDSLSFIGPAAGAPIDDSDKKSFYLLVCGGGGSTTVGVTGERVDTGPIQMILGDSGKELQIGHATVSNYQLPVGDYTLNAVVNVVNPDETSPLYRNKIFVEGLVEGATGCSTAHVNDGGINSSLSGSTGGYYLSLNHHDIYDVVSVQSNNDTIQNAYGLTGSESKEIFLLDNGQKDNYYDFGRLYLNPSLGTGGGALTGDVNLTITYSRFDHASGIGPFTVNSYTHANSNFSYNDIPIYTSPKTGKSFSLRNCLDFRATTDSSGNINPLGLSPRNNQQFLSSYDHYLSRIDKIVLTKEREFDVIRGIPALNPQTPPDRNDAMTLYVLTVPAYTFNIKDITSKYIENKRYTMRDIGAIEKRIENLEYYTSLSLLEQQTEARSITDSNGVDIFKNGILVDPFRGHAVGDVLNADYTCSIDTENGHLRPPFTSDAAALSEIAGSTNGIVLSSDGIATLGYSVYSQFVWQPLASGTVQVNPFSVPSWMGHIKIDDPFDGWYNQTGEPLVKINTQGENDRWKVNNQRQGYGYGTQWNDWESIWSGRTITVSDIYGNRGKDYLNEFSTGATGSNIENRIKLADSAAIRSTETLKNNEGRIGIRVRKLPERLEKLVNNKLVDVSVVPFTRAKTITLNAYGLKPSTQVYPFFDGTSVAEYCGPTGGGASGGDIWTDSEGKVSDMFFSIPETTFRTGERLFRLTDDAINTLSSTTTAADAIYYGLGNVQQRDGDMASTRPIVGKRQVVNDEAIVKDAFDREQYINTSGNNLWIDPLSQSFTINRNDYPGGVFLHSIDLYFQSRDTDIPITLEIRPTIGGWPSLSQSLPFSTVTLIPAEDEIQNNYPNEVDYTRFTFSSPVYIAAGEYSLCLKTTSDLYNLFSAQLGESQLDTGVLITEQPYTGSLFTPQNTGISVPNTNKSLKFKINVCEFVANGEIGYEIPSSEFTGLTADVFKINSGELVPRNTALAYDFDMGVSPNSVDNINIIANENIYLEKPQAIVTNEDFKLDVRLTTSDYFVSPVIDEKRLDLITVNNKINNSTATSSNGELDANAHSSEDGLYGSGSPYPENLELTKGAEARYITRRVTLADGFESNNFKVLMSINKPSEATVQVFIKPLAEEDETPFEEISYTEMTSTTIPDSVNDYDFTDMTFSLASNFDKPIKTFSIKVCLYSSSSTKVPSVRDFRAIALAG